MFGRWRSTMGKHLQHLQRQETVWPITIINGQTSTKKKKIMGLHANLWFHISSQNRRKKLHREGSSFDRCFKYWVHYSLTVQEFYIFSISQYHLGQTENATRQINSANACADWGGGCRSWGCANIWLSLTIIAVQECFCIASLARRMGGLITSFF